MSAHEAKMGEVEEQRRSEAAAAQRRHSELVFLAGFLRGLALSRRFAFDGNERDALRRVSELLLEQAEKKTEEKP